MLKIHFSWGGTDLPEYDPEKHDPERVFAMLCYRGYPLRKMGLSTTIQHETLESV